MIPCHIGGSNGASPRPFLMVTLTLTPVTLSSVPTKQSIWPNSLHLGTQSTSLTPHCICWVRLNTCSRILLSAPPEQLTIKLPIAFPSPHGNSCLICVPTSVSPPPACLRHHTLQSPFPTSPPPTSSTVHLHSHAPTSASIAIAQSPSSHPANDRNYDPADILASIRYIW